MRTIILVAVAALCHLFLCEANPASGSSNHELFIYKDRIRVLYKLLFSKCPEMKQKREMNDALQQAELMILREQYADAMKRFLDCINRTSTVLPTVTPKHWPTKPPITTSTPSKPPITTAASTKPPITTAALTTVNRATTTSPKHWACLNATNFTESWRLDHVGSDIQPRINQNANANNANAKYACDRRDDVQWFRFTGAAGNKMLNKAPKPYSCGARWAMWTNATMPTVVGVPTSVPMYRTTASGQIDDSYASKTDRFSSINLVKCSTDTDFDFVYETRYYSTESCAHTFCGMV